CSATRTRGPRLTLLPCPLPRSPRPRRYMQTRLQRPLETISPPRVITKSAPTQGTQAIANRSSRLLKKSDSCFDRLSTNGKSPTMASLPPFALSLSKGERKVFQHPARFLHLRGNQAPLNPLLASPPFLERDQEIKPDHLLGKFPVSPYPPQLVFVKPGNDDRLALQ